MLTQAIQINQLHKSFGANRAVDGVSFSVQAGEIFSLLGPNGAGKTTTISMLSCLLRPDQGDALVFGKSVRREPMAVKASLGVVPQDIALYEDLSARENLAFWGRMYDLGGAELRKRVDEVLEIIGLTERQNDRVGKYSGGMKRRVNIGVALLHRPRVIYMDEPTVGIDPQSRRSILDSVVALKQQGMTVLYTTHYMEESQELSDHIAIMDHGRIIACGTHAELVKIVGEAHRITLTITPALQGVTPALQGATPALQGVIEAWQSTPGVLRVTADDGTHAPALQGDTPALQGVTLLADDSNRVLPRLFDTASASGVRITSIDVQEPNLESVFLHLTGRALRD